MAKYYNKSPGSLAIGLKNGRSMSLPGKSWTEIPAEDEGSEDLIRAVKRGFVHRSTVDDALAVAPAAAPVAAPAASVAETPAVSEVQSFESLTSYSADTSSRESLVEKTPEYPRRSRKG